jgi:P4 family phage/plasmid primase-like protien
MMDASQRTDFKAVLLDTLGATEGEFVSLGYQDAGGTFHTAVMTPGDAVAARLPTDSDQFFGVNPIAGPARRNSGRGTEADVTRLTALWCDLDVKAGGCPSLDVARAIVAELAIILGTRPSVTVDSGHGLHAYWPIDDGHVTNGDITRARTLLRRFGRLVALVAETHGVSVDNVYDLARMMRLPGSHNNKRSNGEGPKAVAAYADTGGPLTMSEIGERLDEVGVCEEDDDRAPDRGIVSAPAEWKWAERTCAYVVEMIDGWSTDTPTARNPWFFSSHIRLECAHRGGCITEADHRRAGEILAARLAELVATTEPRRTLKRFEISGAVNRAVGYAAAKTDAKAREELGDHAHAAESTSGDDAPNRVPPSVIRLSDKGNALALVREYAKTIRYVPDLGRWIHWNGTRWNIDSDTGIVDTAAGAIASTLPSNGTKESAAHEKRSLSVSGITGMVRLARSDPGMRVSQAKLDANAFQLNTPTGIVDLRTGRQFDHDPNAWHTKLTGVGYDPDADCPKWKEFLETTFGSDTELIRYIQRLIGEAAIGRVLRHVLPFFWGQGHNGKTVLLETIKLVLGPENYAITAPHNFLLAGRDKHETEIARMAGARVVVCSEINEGTRFDEAKVKNLTGGDALTGRFMHGNFFEFQPSHTLFLMGNHQPTVGAGGLAFWRRVRLIPFEHVMPDETKIEDYYNVLVDAEGPAILRWIVEGAVSVLSEPNHPEPDRVIAATKEYAESEDYVRQFVDECVQRVNSSFKLPSGEIYRAYVKWCIKNGIDPKANSVFGRDMAGRGFPSVKSDGKRFTKGLMMLKVDDDDD